MLIIGLTGTIASGKSTVSNYIKKQHNLPVIDADVVAHRVVEPGTPCLKKIVREFGTEVLKNDGSLNRPALGRIIFGDEQKRLRLNSIVHPAVRKEMLKELWRYYIRGTGIVFLDVPLLFEARMHLLCTTTVTIVCSPMNVKRRLMARNPELSEKEVEQRIHSQMSSQEKTQLTDFVLENESDVLSLYARVDRLLFRLHPSTFGTFLALLCPFVQLFLVVYSFVRQYCKKERIY
ncbi:dephospho-CoA kinase [Schizosaccharomyces japonicus yFS275]|uniref:Dephospho-CoA kinase n=1 Tax=Schizosaccharomyces japonicus (strain yFS275 / FY16936) TaxID=402676 RepID=B6K6F7_SCHJY|nr:dephospho-CoA kinase [Schizosaccharomyces japonicus yFS275]EEB09111.1 dephospho-CoA kinase [Schizosaccharomyces japonicus yFS275]